MTDIEVRMASHEAANERRRAGKPIWDETIWLPHWVNSSAVPFGERRDAYVSALRESAWLKREGEGGPLDREIDDLAETFDDDEAAAVLNDIFDRADVARVWIGTRPS